MGNYNSQYANYYGALGNKRRTSNKKNNIKNIIPTFDKKFFIRRVTIDLIGTFLLFVFIILCKVFVTPTSAAAYKYSKNVVNSNFDVKAAVSKVKAFNFAGVKVFYDKNIKGISSEKLEEGMTDWIDGMITKVTGKKSWKAMVKEDYVLPAEGKILFPYGEITDPVTKSKRTNDGVYIGLTEGTEVKACYNGTVKECGEDGQLGQYIIIAHDNNIETKYGNLKELNVKKGDQLKKSQVLGKSGDKGKIDGPHLYFEINQMGESKNPQDYFDFKIK